MDVWKASCLAAAVFHCIAPDKKKKKSCLSFAYFQQICGTQS